VVSSDDSWKQDPKYNWLKELKWYRCSNCERYFCSRCVVKAEFLSRHKYVPQNGQWELADTELFIDRGKYCRECIFDNAGEANIWAALKQNEELVISTLEEE
jgi:hypothetical protein